MNYDYQWLGDKLSQSDRLDQIALERIISDSDDGVHDAAWEIIALRRRLIELGALSSTGIVES